MLYISLLPFLNRPDDAVELLSRWQGGIEILTDGPNWVGHPFDWDREAGRFAGHSGPVSIHSPIFELNLSTPRYPSIREYSFDVYRQCLEWAARIGAEQVVIHPSLHTTPVFLRKEAQEHAKRNLERLGQVAQDAGVELAVENIGFGGDALFDQEEFVRLFDEIPAVRALVDVGHAHINRWDTPGLIQALGERLAAVHLHDNDGVRDSHLPVGRGTIDWQPVWTALRSLRHEYRAILEYQVDTPVETVLAHADFVNSCLRGQMAT